MQAERGQFTIGSGSGEGNKWVGLGLRASLEYGKFRGRNSVRNCILKKTAFSSQSKQVRITDDVQQDPG